MNLFSFIEYYIISSWIVNIHCLRIRSNKSENMIDVIVIANLMQSLTSFYADEKIVLRCYFHYGLLDSLLLLST